MVHATRFGLLMLAVACASASLTWAQDAGGLEIASVTGKFAAMQANQMKITTGDKQDYFILVTPQTNLRYQGKAEPKFLMPGLLVRFSAAISQAGIVESPVKSIEVFTVSQSHQRMSPEQLREQTPGLYHEGGDVGAVAKNSEPAKVEPKKTEPKKTEPQKAEAKKPESKNTNKTAGVPGSAYRVVGQVVGVQGGKIFVQAGQVRVQLELDPDAVITVSSTEAMFSQVGDEVKVSGLRTAGQDKFIQAETVQITGASPLGLAEGKAAKSAKPSRTSKGKESLPAGKDGSPKPSVGSAPSPQKPGTKPPAPKN
jgi:hypothetical protein